MHKVLFKLEAFFGAALLRLWRATIRYEVINPPPKEYRCIYALWHRNLLIIAMQAMEYNMTVMISDSKDGELLAGPVKLLGYKTVRGSTSQNGVQALKTMISMAKKSCLGITPDGPKGPLGTIHQGIFHIALLAKIPIVSICPFPEREWVLNSWDKFRIPKPFSKCKIIYGDPIWINDKLEIPEVEARLRKEL
jgi:lysophospholipid acyltransferase (LPLAT)-like uncharacterized protein